MKTIQLKNGRRKKTKRRKFETSENPDALNEKTVTEARESNNVVGNVGNKKKKKRKRTVEEENVSDKGKKNSVGVEAVENSLVEGVVAIEKVKMKKKRRRKNEGNNR